jgi:peptide/nickel transport system permease protein
MVKFWRRNTDLAIWLIVFLLIAIVAVFGPLLLADPTSQSPVDRLQAPSAAHLLGTDAYGRDVLSRVVNAAQVSFGIAAAIALGATVFGTIIGLASGYWHGAGSVLMRAMDALMAFPGIVLSIALVTAIGAGAFSEIVALTVVFTPLIARVVRSRTLALSGRLFVTAARASGMRGPKILFVHVLPNALPTVLVQGILVFAAALLLDGTLSFLGMGVQPPTPTWGNMIAEARPFLSIAPMYVIAPGLAIIIVVVTVNAIGSALRAVVDPRARSLMKLGRRPARRRMRDEPAVVLR